MDIDGFRALAERPRDAENPSRSARPPHARRLQTTLTCKAKLRAVPKTQAMTWRSKRLADVNSAASKVIMRDMIVLPS